MDQKQKKKVIIGVSAGLIFLLIIGGFLYWMLSGDDAPTGPVLQKSDSMATTIGAAPAAPTGGTLEISPRNVQFQNDQPNTAQIILKAVGAPVEIRSVQIPTTDADVLSVANIDCPAPGAQLAAGTSCRAAVTWTAQRTINSSINIDAYSTNTGNAPVAIPQAISVTGVSTRPASATAAIPTQGGVPGQVPPPSDASQAQAIAQAPIPEGPSPRQQFIAAYADARRGAPQAATPAGQLQASARSPWTSWDAIGIGGSKSSRPTDMSRVITPDKPISAVIAVPIDTRMAVSAVAMVDRDVYGNNGRTVVIPRGTKIVGTIGGSTERVGVAWKELIRPDGVRFVFEGSSGDAMGRAGIPGRVNERNLERYGYSLLSGVFSAGTAVALGGQQVQANPANGAAIQTQDSKAVATDIIRQRVDQIGNDFFQRKRNIPVQITVAAGTRITVWSIGDLRLKPAGEPDDNPNGQDAAAGQQGNSAGFVGGSRLNPNSFQQRYRQQAQQNAQAQNGGNGQQNGQQAGQYDPQAGAQLQVNNIDAAGNYVPPGSSAPAPGSLALSNGNGAATGVAPSSSSAPTTRAPWDRR